MINTVDKSSLKKLKIEIKLNMNIYFHFSRTFRIKIRPAL